MNTSARTAQTKYINARRNQVTPMAAVLCKALSGALVVEDTFTTDSATGYKVREFCKEAPCTLDDVRGLLLNNRVVHLEEIYEAVGKNVHQYMVSKGYIRADRYNPRMFWITAAGARNYNLPKVLNCAFPA